MVVRNGDPSIDGRVLRGERNREAIVDALLELLQSGVARPSAREIADAAGVSLRSVFQHFDDLETLYGALVARQTERVARFAVDIDRDAPFAERLASFAEQRARFYEQVSPVRRATLLVAHDSPTLQRALADTAARHAREVSAAFAPELRHAHTPADLRAAIVAATSWETWERLRRTQRCSAEQARRVVVALVEGVVATGV
jgi:TetR/AcrR family transcriptional regulator, regulator of autoinduction and epiphytic fitness